MPESSSSQTPTMQTRLAEMDRRLRDIQSELIPDEEQAPGAEAERPEHEGEQREQQPPPPPPKQAPESPERPAASGPGPAAVRPPSPQPPPEPRRRESGVELRGRAGPLASLLQRATRREGSSQELEVLAELSGSLLGSLRELLAGYEAVFSHAQPADRSVSAPSPTGGKGEPSADFAVSAGPFGTVSSVHEFERAMSNLPGVREVTIRSYEGADRAIFHVELEQTP